MDEGTSVRQGGRQLLVVAGSGRSGTSLFTGLTGRLGVHIPKPEVSANRSNPRGFGEPRWLVDYHNDLLSSVDVVVEDGRPEAWDLTDELAGDPKALDPLVEWLEAQFGESDRVVVKDPRLAWFLQLHRAAAVKVSAQMRVATMLRHPAEVMRSREIAYGTRTKSSTRVIGWLTMMLGTEVRTRDLPRATVRYDDLLADWRAALGHADTTIGMGLFEQASQEQLADAGDLVDPTLHRSSADWDELELPARVLDLATRTYDAYGRLVGVPAPEQGEPRGELDVLRDELGAYYDECFDVARTRTGAFARRERRKAVRRVREELRQAAVEPPQGVGGIAKRAVGRLRRTTS
ncbi:MAG TPA: sulfotransferase family protein [Nocardioides sp.]|jgi:hypothetical protein|uniref:sulfotransferase family protein n=1 Tax=Nocardioides sp. TaxID=35761 RepID=UPI002E2F3245|nr:sulfotransferase family protein [Nocardioides sp.]HEX3929499.1 sulfotransferase family protein [Nocardioides sp.]